MDGSYVDEVPYAAEHESDEEVSGGVGAWLELFHETDGGDPSNPAGGMGIPRELLPPRGRRTRAKFHVNVSLFETDPEVQTRVSRHRSRWPVLVEVVGFADRMQVGLVDPDAEERVAFAGISGLPEEALAEEGDRCHAVVELECVEDGTGESVEATTDGPTLRWTVDCGPEPSRPAVGEDTVCIGTPDGLRAVDVESGALRWQFEGVETVLSAPLRPTIDAGTVYAGDREGRVWAVDAATGTRTWRTETGDGVVVAPTVGTLPGEGGTDPRRLVYVGTTDGIVAALDADDGSTCWRTELEPGEHSLRAPNSVLFAPVLHGTDLYVSGLDGRLTSIDAVTGEHRRVLYDPDGLEWGLPARPGVAGDAVYYNGATTLQALDATTGDDRWEDPPEIRSLVVDPPVQVAGTVVAGAHGKTVWASRPDEPLCGIDPETGGIRWERGVHPSGLSVVDGTVYTTAGDAATAFDPDTGDVVWRYPTGPGHLTATEDGIYAVGGNDDGTATLYALDEVESP